MMKIILFLIALILSSPLYSDETDNFTFSKVTLDDSSKIINEQFNEYVLKALDDANNSGKTKNDRDLYKSLKKYITDKTGKRSIIRYLYKYEGVAIIHITKNQSIYKNWTLREGTSLGKKNTFIASIINFNGTQIGMDKLEHLFRTGRILYVFLDKGWEFENVMKLSYFLERWFLGGGRIGASITSYGDLAANFNGIRLWNDFLGKYPDPLGRKLGPYIALEDEMWVLKEEIDLRNYIDDSFDERINNSVFSHKSSKDKFAKNIQEAKRAELVDEVGYSENLEIINNLINKYGIFAVEIINLGVE